MTQLSDEVLVAYADGELVGEEAAAVERALENDRDAQETLRLFRETAELSRAAYDDVVREPIPDRLIETLQGGPVAAVSQPRFRAGGGLAAMALAASITLAVGVVGGFGLSNLGGDAAPGSSERWVIGSISAQDSAVYGVLETLPSGHLRAVASGDDGAEIMALTTFTDRNGRYCRDFQATVPGNGGSDAAFGVACRSMAGDWRVEALIAAPAANAADSYVTASGPAEDPFMAVLDSLGASGPISAAEETSLLRQGWR